MTRRRRTPLSMSPGSVLHRKLQPLRGMPARSSLGTHGPEPTVALIHCAIRVGDSAATIRVGPHTTHARAHRWAAGQIVSSDGEPGRGGPERRRADVGVTMWGMITCSQLRDHGDAVARWRVGIRQLQY